ncbi:MAG TPA: CRISPR-associated helicase Cas3', partial [Armatimonadota bacterium]|nr:CRISPR-associated helicase Cas3' [Armatimonadota bacterium]
PEAVGTVDQALRAALDVKFGLLRLLGLSSKVLIIDEVHAYDEYMTVLMERLLEWLSVLRVPVILLSATLSFEQKRRLVEAYRGADVLPRPQGEAEPYPLLTFVPLQGAPVIVPVDRDPDRDREIEVHLRPGLLGDPSGIADLAANLVSDGGCACVLLNTVKSAQAVFRQLRRLRDEGKVDLDTQLILFHARFRAGRRDQIERKVLSLFGKDAGPDTNPGRPERAILCATQVVEQSLDVDFDVLISEIAPVDLLLQRCGRVYRHERGPRKTGPAPRLYVLLPPEGSFDFGSTGFVYQEEPLLRTVAILVGREQSSDETDPTTTIRLPDEFRPLIESVYGGRPIPAGIIEEDTLLRAREKRQEKLDDARHKAKIHLNPAPSVEGFTLAENDHFPADDAEENERADYFHAQTRLGDDSRRALILHDDWLLNAARSENPPSRAVLKQLFLQQAGIPTWWLRDVRAEDGSEPFSASPKWLRGPVILPMRDGAWRGVNNKGEAVVIRDLARDSGAKWEENEIGLTYHVGEDGGEVATNDIDDESEDEDGGV